MLKILTIDAEYKQNIQQILPNKEQYDLTLTFQETIGDPGKGNWFIDINYKNTVKVYNRRICANINLLNDYKNILPYGLFVYCKNDIEPWFLNSFSLGLTELYIASYDELLEINNLVYI